MTKEARAKLRQALLAAGFGHADIGYDGDGTGAYTETWISRDGANSVLVDWGPRS